MWCTIVFWACGMYMLHSSGAGISVDYALAMQVLWCRIYRISQSSIYTEFVLGIINATMNLKQYGPLTLICVETNQPDSWFKMAVLGCRSLVLVSIIIIRRRRWRNPGYSQRSWNFENAICDRACENQPCERKKMPIFSVFAVS